MQGFHFFLHVFHSFYLIAISHFFFITLRLSLICESYVFVWIITSGWSSFSSRSSQLRLLLRYFLGEFKIESGSLIMTFFSTIVAGRGEITICASLIIIVDCVLRCIIVNHRARPVSESLTNLCLRFFLSKSSMVWSSTNTTSRTSYSSSIYRSQSW